jgi:hypothetical protein
MTLLTVLDVQVLDGERTAIGLLQALDQLAERHPGSTVVRGGVHDLVEVRLGEAELVVIEIRMRRWRRLQRIQVGHQVALLAIRLDEAVDAEDADLARLVELLAAGAVRTNVGQRVTVPVGQVEAAEEDRPPLVDRIRVVLPALILFGDPILVRQRDRFESAHDILL